MRIDDRVEVWFAGEWCRGTVRAVGGDGTYGIEMERYGLRFLHRPRTRPAP